MPESASFIFVALVLCALPHFARTPKGAMILSAVSLGLCVGALFFVAAFMGLARAMGNTSGVTSAMGQIAAAGGVILASSLFAIRGAHLGERLFSNMSPAPPEFPTKAAWITGLCAFMSVVCFWIPVGSSYFSGQDAEPSGGFDPGVIFTLPLLSAAIATICMPVFFRDGRPYALRIGAVAAALPIYLPLLFFGFSFIFPRS